MDPLPGTDGDERAVSFGAALERRGLVLCLMSAAKIFAERAPTLVAVPA